MLFLPRDNIFPHRFLTLMRIYRKINSFLFLKVYRGDHTSQERRGTYKQGDRRSPVVKTPGFHCKGVRVWFLVRKLRPRMLYRVVKNKTNKNQGEETACVFHPSPLFSIQRYFLIFKKLPCTPVRRGNPQCKKRQHTLQCGESEKLKCPSRSALQASHEKVGLPYVLWFSSVQSRLTLCDPMDCMPHQASLSITNSRSLLKLMSIELMMPSNHLILCRPLLLQPSIFPSIRVFSSESALHIRWPKYWSFSLSISPSNEYSGLISFRMDW